MTDFSSPAAETNAAGEPLVTIDDDGALRQITLNRPEAHNSLNRPLRKQLIAAFTETKQAAERGEVRAVILRAEGGAFCSGQDLKEQLADMRSEDKNLNLKKVTHEYNPMIAALAGIPVPVIAAIHGPAAGAGWGVAMACDFRVMSQEAFFKGAFSHVGLCADSSLSATLVQAVGQAKALELLLLDEKIPATYARELGLVTQVVAADEVEQAAMALASRFAAGPTAAFREIKALVKDTSSIAAAGDAEAAAQARLLHTADHAEAIQAFLEKRQPQFSGR